jgi:RND family efflux transporter MFP subunit
MTRKILKRLSWPLGGLGVTFVLLAQTGAVNPPEVSCPIASTLLAKCRLSGPSPASQTAEEDHPRVTAEGRVVAYPGAEVIVGTEVEGRIVKLPVEEKSVVRKGDLIAELNADDLRASLAEAEAKILEAGSDERFDQIELNREQSLMARRAGTAQNIDSLRHSFDAARARRAGAVAARDRLAALIAKTRILAPIDGVVMARHVQPGETIEAAARIVTIADLNRLRIEAEVDEYDTGRIGLGAPVQISAEGYPSPWPGRVEEIPDSVINRKLRPEDPGRPVDARVLPVKIALTGHTPLKLGQRVEVQISETKSLAER